MDFTLPDGRPERDRTPVRLIAARDIAMAEQAISASHPLRGANEFEDLAYDERVRYRAVNKAFYELTELQGVADEDASLVLELFAENPELANANLKRIEMNGEWDAADPFERELLGLLYDADYKSLERLARKSPKAKVEVIIPAGFTKQNDFVALRRKRRLIIAEHINGEWAKRPSLYVDKVSTFALDITQLAELSEPAVHEVRLIVAMTMYNAVDWGALEHNQEDIQRLDDEDYADFMAADAKRKYAPGHEPLSKATTTAFNDAMRLARAMHQYGLSVEQLEHRLHRVERPAELRDASGKAFIEEALHSRSELLTPASTTYYMHS